MAPRNKTPYNQNSRIEILGIIIDPYPFLFEFILFSKNKMSMNNEYSSPFSYRFPQLHPLTGTNFTLGSPILDPRVPLPRVGVEGGK